MGAVTLHIHGVVIVIGKVPTANVINVAIPVVVDAIPLNFPWVSPDVTHEIGMVIIYPRINNANDQVRITRL